MASSESIAARAGLPPKPSTPSLNFFGRKKRGSSKAMRLDVFLENKKIDFLATYSFAAFSHKQTSLRFFIY